MVLKPCLSRAEPFLVAGQEIMSCRAAWGLLYIYIYISLFSAPISFFGSWNVLPCGSINFEFSRDDLGISWLPKGSSRSWYQWLKNHPNFVYYSPCTMLMHLLRGFGQTCSWQHLHIWRLSHQRTSRKHLDDPRQWLHCSLKSYSSLVELKIHNAKVN